MSQVAALKGLALRRSAYLTATPLLSADALYELSFLIKQSLIQSLNSPV